MRSDMRSEQLVVVMTAKTVVYPSTQESNVLEPLKSCGVQMMQHVTAFKFKILIRYVCIYM